MASHIEMKRLGDDIAAVKRLAAALLATPGADWTDWERLFLDGMTDRRSAEPLSPRQREILIELRDAVRVSAVVHDFAVSRLVRDCFLHRFDLDEEDCAFIERLAAEAPKVLKRRPLYRLFAIAQALDVVPRFAEAS